VLHPHEENSDTLSTLTKTQYHYEKRRGGSECILEGKWSCLELYMWDLVGH
jgi:hypothetical protein